MPTNLTVTATRVAAVKVIEQFTGPAAEAITAGQYVRLNTTTGKTEIGNGTNAAEARDGGIAINSAAAGETVTAVSKGLIDMGDAFTDATYDDDVYLSDTDGAISLTSSDSSQTKIIGTTVPGWGHTTADKLLRVDL